MATRYSNVSNWQFLLLALLIAIFSSLLVSINSWYMDFRTLPRVHLDKAGQCVKVENLENGHAFNCEDLDVLLRRYRKITE